MVKFKIDILRLREEGKSYKEISNLLNCSKATVAYHCGLNQKSKTRERSKLFFSKHPFLRKISAYSGLKNKFIKTKINNGVYFLKRKIVNFMSLKKSSYGKASFNLNDVLQKFSEHPKCYLTGKEIDIYETETYHFDHILPISKGGDSSLENLGICIKEANSAKSDLTHDEFVQLCKDVLIHHGYKVEKVEKNGN